MFICSQVLNHDILVARSFQWQKAIYFMANQQAERMKEVIQGNCSLMNPPEGTYFFQPGPTLKGFLTF